MHNIFHYKQHAVSTLSRAFLTTTHNIYKDSEIIFDNWGQRVTYTLKCNFIGLTQFETSHKVQIRTVVL
jgi:hypothetical protein